MIEISVNGEPRHVPPGCTLADLVDDVGCGRRGIAVAVDEEVVPRSAWEATEVGTGNRVEILRAAQGGC
ncbi:MAG: sulfur carrier protein ThiS [Acidimicrobiaceae bacterium]|nr:sulfur carrier protein ThiS [Acidimicrobiaceae bacterium]